VSIGFSSDSFNQLLRLDVLSSCNQSNAVGRCATGRYFQVLGNIHDIESYLGMDNVVSLNAQIFLCHWGHLAIIFMWVSGNLFHIGWNGNYELWVKNPIKSIPIAHGIWDPHFGLSLSVSDAYSGIYNWLYTVGFNSVFHIYNFVIACELLAVISILLAKVHLVYLDSKLQWLASHTANIYLQPIFIWPLRLFVACFDLGGLRLNFHIGAMIGFFSIAWSGHLVHVAIPAERGINVCWSNVFNSKPFAQGLYPFYTGNWALYSGRIDMLDNHIFGSAALTDKLQIGSHAILTFLGGIQASDTCSLYLTDIAHHHLAVGVLFVLSAHLYSSFVKRFGHRISDLLKVNGNSGLMISCKSEHLQLSLACTGLGVYTSVVGQHMYSLTPYVYLSADYVTTAALYVHHQYIASILMMAAFAHAGIFLIRDYTVNVGASEDPILRVLAHKAYYKVEFIAPLVRFNKLLDSSF
jgi:photosystem I P700 chlorophyll a apoprotein A2